MPSLPLSSKRDISKPAEQVRYTASRQTHKGCSVPFNIHPESHIPTPHFVWWRLTFEQELPNFGHFSFGENFGHCSKFA